MNTVSLNALIILGSFARLAAQSQGGFLDPSFDSGLGPNSLVRATLLQPDGKVLIGGDFSEVDGVPRRCVARLTSDGQGDPSFDSSAGADLIVRCLALDSQGRVLIGGAFSNYGGAPRERLARLNSDGTLDASFLSPLGANGSVYAIAQQPDGRILVAGSFAAPAGAASPFLIRVHPNGSLDSKFAPPAGGPSNVVTDLALEPGGKIVIVGGFLWYDGQSRRRIARLHADGSLDHSFSPGFGFNSGVQCIARLDDGRFYVGGDFTEYNFITRRRIVRLRDNGDVDLAFDPGWSTWNGIATIHGIVPLADGRVLINGEFQTYQNIVRRCVARIHPDGALDASFDTGQGATGPSVLSLSLQPDGRAVLGGWFASFAGEPRPNLVRIFERAPAPQAHCQAGVSSQGCVASIGFSGTPTVSASLGFTLRVENLESSKSGMIFYGLGGRAALPWAAGSSSFFCVRAPTQRMSLRGSGGGMFPCDGAFTEDWLGFVSANPGALGAPLSAGLTVNAQAWFRDPPAPKSTSLSNALEFVTLP